MPEEWLLVPRDGLFDTMKVTTCMPSCTILWKANLLHVSFINSFKGDKMIAWQSEGET